MMSKMESLVALRNFGFIRGLLTVLLTGILILQTEVPITYQATAEPVIVNAVAPADFSDVVKAVTPAVVSVKARKYDSELSSNELFLDNTPLFDFGQPNLPGFGPPQNFSLFGELDDLPDNHPLAGSLDQLENDEFGKRPENQGKDFFVDIGSGFFVSDDGLVVTNEHVVRNADEIVVVTNDGAEFVAELIGLDERTDIAVLKIDQPNELAYVKFSDDIPEVGEWVITVGNPFGYGGTVNAGIVSARGRDIGRDPYNDFLQIDAPLNQGNSGGPAFNLKGEVVGVNAAIHSPLGGNSGIAFAIPCTIAQDVVADLRDDGSVVRGWLGVQVQKISKDIAESIDLNEPLGALVVTPRENSPASKAGLKPGDAIVKVNNTSILGPRDLARVIASYTPGSNVNLTVWRNGEELTLSTKLEQLPEDPANNDRIFDIGENQETTSLGLGLKSAIDAGVAEGGVIITTISPGSVAFKKGLRVGNIITEVSGKKVDTPNDITESIREAKNVGRKAILMRLRSGESSRFVAFPIDRS